MRTPCLAALAALLASPVLAQPSGSAADAPRYTSAADLAAKVAVTKDGAVNAPIPAGPGAQMLIVRRDGPGEVEVHAKLADFFVVQTGHAEVIVGGSLSGQRDTGPGEQRGGMISGGTRYALGPGDVLWIPAGLPHQVIAPKGGSFQYVVAKVAKAP